MSLQKGKRGSFNPGLPYFIFSQNEPGTCTYRIIQLDEAITVRHIWIKDKDSDRMHLS